MHWLIAVGASLALIGPAPPSLQRFESVEPHMGTLVRVTVYTPDEPRARAAFQVAFDRMRALDAILSDYRSDSELNHVTRIAVGVDVPISEDLFAVLAASQALADATSGAFDITQGPVIQLWRDARKSGRVPDAAALNEAARHSGFRKLHLDAQHRTVRFDMPGMQLDVGAIGKGYAASEAIEVLTGFGVRSALVAMSGDLAFSAAPPGERGWRIALHGGDPSLLGVPRVLHLTNAAVSTSGNSEQHLDVNGRRYSHIIDPASGMALTDHLTVTVIAPHGLEADGLDTAISVMGAERGLELIESRPGAAALLVERTRGKALIRRSSRFAHLAAEVPDSLPSSYR